MSLTPACINKSYYSLTEIFSHQVKVFRESNNELQTILHNRDDYFNSQAGYIVDHDLVKQEFTQAQTALKNDNEYEIVVNRCQHIKKELLKIKQKSNLKAYRDYYIPTSLEELSDDLRIYLNNLNLITMFNLMTKQQIWFYIYLKDLDQKEPVCLLIRKPFNSLLNIVYTAVNFYSFYLPTNTIKQQKYLKPTTSFITNCKEIDDHFQNIMESLGTRNNQIITPLYTKCKNGKNKQTLIINLPEIQDIVKLYPKAMQEHINNTLFSAYFAIDGNELINQDHAHKKLQYFSKKKQWQGHYAQKKLKPIKLTKLKQSRFSNQLMTLTKPYVPKPKKYLNIQFDHGLCEHNAGVSPYEFRNMNDLFATMPNSEKLKQKILQSYLYFNEQFSFRCQTGNSENYNYDINESTYSTYIMISTLNFKDEQQLLNSYLKARQKEHLQADQPVFDYQFETQQQYGYNILLASPILDYRKLKENSNYDIVDYHEYHLCNNQDQMQSIVQYAPNINTSMSKGTTFVPRTTIIEYNIGNIFTLKLYQVDLTFKSTLDLFNENSQRIANQDQNYLNYLKQIT